MGTDGLLTPPGSLNNGTMISLHALGSGNASRIERAGVHGSLAVLTGHRVCGRQGTSAAIQILE
jgi:hypothetical protein